MHLRQCDFECCIEALLQEAIRPCGKGARQALPEYAVVECLRQYHDATCSRRFDCDALMPLKLSAQLKCEEVAQAETAAAVLAAAGIIAGSSTGAVVATAGIENAPTTSTQCGLHGLSAPAA